MAFRLWIGLLGFLINCYEGGQTETSKLLEKIQKIQNLFAVYTNTFDQSHIQFGFVFFVFFFGFTAKHVHTFKILYILHLRTQYSRDLRQNHFKSNMCIFLNEQFSRINLLTSLKHFWKWMTSNFADYFNKCSLELLLILLAFKLKFHSFIMVIGDGVEREEEK